MKFSVIYFSKDGHTKTMADEVVKGALTIDGIEAKAFSLDDVDEKYVSESKVVAFGSPVYNAGMCWQMKKWLTIDSKDYNFEGKLGSSFATANYLQGGLNTVSLELSEHMIARGIMVYTGGTALGKPYLHLGAVSRNCTEEEDKEQFTTLGRRLAAKAVEIFS